MTTCSDLYPSNVLYNVPRDVVSYAGDAFSASRCEAKCFYSHNYAASSTCVVTNDGDRLSIKYDGGGDVTYNGSSYTPTVLKIFCPSITKFNGQQTAAELVIEHAAKNASITGLLVCIPLSTMGPPTNGAIILQDIIKQSPIEPNVAEALNISDFNLNTLIPKAPFYTYQGPLPYDGCNPTATFQYVVFHPNRLGGIALPAATLKSLRALIHFSFIVAHPGKGVFFNAKGTTQTGNVGDGLYMQCKPVGASDEEVVVKEISPLSAPAISGDFLGSIFAVLVGIVVIFVTFKVSQFVLEFIGKHKEGKYIHAS